MEDRTAPAVITVTTTADDTDPNDGSVSLREAILSVNAHADAGADVAAHRTSSYATAPPAADTIDFAIAGSGVHTITLGTDLPAIASPVVLDGYSQPGASPNTLAAGDNAALRIELDANAHEALMVSAAGSTVRGLAVLNASGAAIGLGAGGDVVAGNFVGLRADGATAAGNLIGVGVVSDGNRIGGTDRADRNVVSGNTRTGVAISSASDNLVQGNLIGTDAAGTQKRANGDAGVLVVSSSSRANTVGGTASGAGNVISGNGGGAGADAGDAGDGILMLGATQTLVQGNRIGTDATGTLDLGNAGDGVEGFFAIDNLLGGNVAEAGNTIAYNGGAGVLIDVGSSSGDTVRRNAIFANGGLGIDLGAVVGHADGLTPNDPGDGDIGSNGLQNFPVLAAAASGPGGTAITGLINTNANTALLIDFYASPAADPSGFGEGQTYLGSVPVVTDGSGNATFTATFPVVVPVGQFVTATATTVSSAPYGDTSEFSQAIDVRSSLPADTTPPTVDRFEVRGTPRKTVTQIVLTFSEAMNRAGAEDLKNYVLTTQTSRGTTPLSLSSALYDSATHSVTLTLAKPVSVRSLSGVTLRVRGDRNLTDLAGNLLDGDANGTPGGDFVRRLSDATFLPA